MDWSQQKALREYAELCATVGCRRCRKCGHLAPLSFFMPAKKSLMGYSHECRGCFGARSREEQRARRADPVLGEKLRQKRKKYRADNRDRIAAVRRLRYSRKRDQICEARRAKPPSAQSVEARRRWARAYRAANRERVREAQRKYGRKRWRERAKDPAFALRMRLGHQIRQALMYTGKTKRRRPTFSLLGYNGNELRAHLEKQFLKGMGWHNMPEWHIDHIVPLASFTITGEDDPSLARAWALTNLRPVWANDNLAKSAKREFLI